MNLRALNIDELYRELKEHQPRLGFDPTQIEQRSSEWHRMRSGVVTGSKAAAFLSDTSTQTYDTFLCQIVAEIITGKHADEVTAKALSWGIEHEEAAKDLFSFITGLDVYSVPFVFRDLTATYGCSPDGITSDGIGLELKCPYSTSEYVRFVRTGDPKPDEYKQVQFCMWVTGAKAWHFAKYDPRVQQKPMHNVLIKRDHAMIRDIERRSVEFMQNIEECLHAFSQ